MADFFGDDDRRVSERDAAEYLALTLRDLRKRVDEGAIPVAEHRDGRFLFLLGDLRAYSRHVALLTRRPARAMASA